MAAGTVSDGSTDDMRFENRHRNDNVKREAIENIAGNTLRNVVFYE